MIKLRNGGASLQRLLWLSVLLKPATAFAHGGIGNADFWASVSKGMTIGTVVALSLCLVLAIRGVRPLRAAGIGSLAMLMTAAVVSSYMNGSKPLSQLINAIPTLFVFFEVMFFPCWAIVFGIALIVRRARGAARLIAA